MMTSWILSAFLGAASACASDIVLLLPQRYRRREEAAREDAGVMTSALAPWNNRSAFMAGTVRIRHHFPRGAAFRLASAAPAAYSDDLWVSCDSSEELRRPSRRRRSSRL